MAKRIEVQGKEIAIRNSHGDIAIIPIHKVKEVESHIASGCHGCIDAIVDSLPKYANKAEEGVVVPEDIDPPSKTTPKVNETPPLVKMPTIESLKASFDPRNWGLTDYTDKGDFKTAYTAAKKAGDTNFMWNNKRYNTDYAGTPRQEAGAYGIGGKPLNKEQLDNVGQVNLYGASKRYPPGHISVATDNDQVSIDWGSDGNNNHHPDNVNNTRGESIQIYGIDKGELYDKWDELENRRGEFNLIFDNCADNVCDALNIPRNSYSIDTPTETMDKIKKVYPSQKVTGRTYNDYVNLSTQLWHSKDYDAILKSHKDIIGLTYSPEIAGSNLSKSFIVAIQNALVAKGYKLPNSTMKSGRMDGVLGQETIDALEAYKKSQQQ